MEMLFKLVSGAWPKIFTASWALCHLGALREMNFSVLIKEWSLALLANKLQRIYCVLDESLSRCRIEILSTFRTVLTLLLPFNYARTTKESLTISTNNDVISYVVTDVAFKFFS